MTCHQGQCKDIPLRGSCACLPGFAIRLCDVIMETGSVCHAAMVDIPGSIIMPNHGGHSWEHHHAKPWCWKCHCYLTPLPPPPPPPPPLPHVHGSIMPSHGGLLYRHRPQHGRCANEDTDCIHYTAQTKERFSLFVTQTKTSDILIE